MMKLLLDNPGIFSLDCYAATLVIYRDEERVWEYYYMAGYDGQSDYIPLLESLIKFIKTKCSTQEQKAFEPHILNGIFDAFKNKESVY